MAVSLVGALACGHRSSPSSCPSAGTAQADQGRYHIPYGSSGNYSQNPPSSGPHWPCWAPYQPATTVIPSEQWIHNLEHGGVVLLFRCSDATSCPAAAQALATIDQAAPDAPTGGHRILVTAYPGLPKAYAAVAWDWLYMSDSADAAAFDCFIGAHEGQGPEDIYSGGSCP